MALEDKFSELQQLLADQQTAIVNALDSILTALGAPPPTATVTLADTLAMMVALNNNVIGMAIANGSYHAAVLEQLELLNTNADTMITNNSLNAQRTIAAIYATFCECTTETPLLGPPLDVTPTSLVDEAKCRRIQYYLSVFGNWLNKIANYGASGAAITGGTIATLLSVAALDAGLIATGAEVGAVAGPPGIVIGAVVGLIAVAVYTLGGSVLIDYANQFSDATLRDNMVQALFAANNADEGYVAFDTTLSASMETIPAAIIKALWWAAWSNDIYSGTPTVDDSAFDGTICVDASEVFPPTSGCVSFTSAITEQSVGSSIQAIAWPDGVYTSPMSASGADHDLTADRTVFGASSIVNMWISSVPNCHMYWEASGYPNFEVTSTPAQLPATGGNFYTCVHATTPFTITICVEEP